MRPLLTIGGVGIPDPSTYKGTTSTVVDNERNAYAYMVGDVIRDDIGKVEASWRFIEAQAWADILKLFSIKRGGHFVNTVTFFCQDTNDWETRTMYVNDRQADIFLRRADGSIRGYTGASFHLIEV